MPCPPHPPAPGARARLSVRPSVPIWQRQRPRCRLCAASACPKRFPLLRGAHGGSWERRGALRSPPTPRRRRRQAGRAGRGSPGCRRLQERSGSVPKQAPNCRFLGKGSDGTEGSVVLLRALGTLDAARFGTPRSRQLDGFNLFPLHFIFARLQAANCSPVAWPASVLLHEPGFTRARLTPRCWDVMGEAGDLLSLPCWALHWAPGYLLASCRSLPLASSKSFFFESAGDLSPSSKSKFPKILLKLHMDEW